MSAAQTAKRRRGARLIPIDPGFHLDEYGVSVKAAGAPLATKTLGEVGAAYRISGKKLTDSYLVIDFEADSVPWIDPRTIRVFFAPPRARAYQALWNSGFNPGLGYIWARVRRPGTYVALGLPRDRILLETLRHIATHRRLENLGPEEGQRLATEAFKGLLGIEGRELDELRDRIAGIEVAYGADRSKDLTSRRGQGFGVAAPLLPGGVEAFGDLGGLIAELSPLPGGLPEEELFFPPGGRPPIEWWPEPEPLPWPRIPPELIRPPWIPRIPLVPALRWILCLWWARDWPMYMHDESHTGRASCSAIDKSNVATLTERHRVSVDGQVNSQPAVVAGKAYVGTMNAGATGVGGVMYKINISTGVVDDSFSVDDGPARQGRGIACTPAVAGGKIYFSALNGKVYRLDAATMTQDWVVDLRNQDLGHNQPVDHGSDWATGWSSPVVRGGRVFVGSGEGEHDSFGYVYALDASTGDVDWLFCTDKFVDPNNPGSENQPNVIPPSHWTGGGSPPAPFTLAAADPAHPGSAPWSSAAYDAGLDRVYIGTGNADPDNPLPDPRYASGMISLDASTGTFEGFFQPDPGDSYRPAADLDVDVPGAPTLFTRGSDRLLGFGSKNGSYFLLDADGLALVERRQLLPYDSSGDPLPNVDPPNNNNPRENKSGVFGTAAVDFGRQTLFVGLGGYSGAIDNATTPFIRAMRWTDLGDAWPTTGSNPPKYSMATPPVYSTSGEAGLTNVSSVNGVVFVGTTKPSLYALDADTGFCLWSAPSFGPGSYCLGAAIYGSYIVAGCGGSLYIYSL